MRMGMRTLRMLRMLHMEALIDQPDSCPSPTPHLWIQP